MVPISNSHLKNTAGGSYTKQTQGGTIVGISTTTTIITKAIQVKDVNTGNTTLTTAPKELSGARTYNTQKILSGGTFAYNAAKNSTWVLTRVTSTLAGVSKTFLQFMGAINGGLKYPYFVSDHYTNATSLIRKNQFSRTGYDASGNKITKRTTWITDPSASTPATADFGTSTSIPSRAYPGELYILTNFVTYNPATSSNKYYYSPITGK